MDPREEPTPTPPDNAGPDMRERLRASIACQTAAIKRAAAQRFHKGASGWPDHGESDAAFRALAEAWEREARLPQRGWEPDLPDQPMESVDPEMDEAPVGDGEARELSRRFARALNALFLLLDHLSTLVQRRAADSPRPSARGACASAAKAASRQSNAAGAKPIDDQQGDGDGGGPIGDGSPDDPIGDFAARILEELLDKDGGPRNDRGRRR